MEKIYKITIGSVALALLLVFVFPLLRLSEVKAGFASVQGSSDIEAANWELNSANSVNGLKNTKTNRDFNLNIPKIGLQHRVVENVSPGNESEYGPIIEKYIAHGEYTRLPDEATTEGNVYLFAHRDGAKNGRNFGFFKHLDKLVEGDKAYVIYDGKTYTYSLYTAFVINPTDTWVYSGESAFPSLTLQTCENGEDQRLILKFRLQSVS